MSCRKICEEFYQILFSKEMICPRCTKIENRALNYFKEENVLLRNILVLKATKFWSCRTAELSFSSF